MRTFRRILSLVLAVLLFCGSVPVMARGASVSYYQTSKADVPIWSAASSSSTKIRTIASTGTVLKVTGSTTNSAGNLWYKLSDGYWVFSGNVTKHSHVYTGGICNGSGCGYEWPYSVSSYSGTFQVTNTSGAKIWSRPYSNKSTNVRLASYGSTMTVTGKTTNQEGNTWYRLSDGYWVFSGNVAQRYTISYNANGGYGAPGTQYALNGIYLTLSSTVPTRSGHIFQGWATSSGGSVSYRPGYSYRFTSNVTLYAVWKACSHSAYTGGYCETCGYEYPISVSSYSGTFQVINTDGAKIWNRPYSQSSTNVRLEKYGTLLSISGKTTNAENHVWYRLTDGYWVYSNNVAQRYTISYNANGGSGAPSSQYVLAGSSLKLSSVKPVRAGHIFQGWGTSASTSTVSYKPGTSYSFTGSRTLYAVWKACSHSAYTGGYCETCGYEYPISVSNYSATFVVTNSDGCKVWNRPYSHESTHLRTEAYGTSLTVTGKTVNAEDHTWYRLSDGCWVYSGNVTQLLTVRYDANGGSGAPGSQTVLKGASLKISSVKPTRVGYLFQGWGTSASTSTVSYKAATSYTFTANKTLYAVWKACGHSAYSGGYCEKCGYEYPISVSKYASPLTYVVTNDSGAKIWSRPYSHESTHLRTEAYKTALTVTGKTVNAEDNTWYQLSDGNWVYSGNVTRQLTVRYNANGGSGAPGSQTVLKGAKLKLSSVKPARVGYLFQGWGTSASTSTVSYKPGTSYTFTGNKTLYAVWKACGHSDYTGGYCESCGYEYPITVSKYASALTYVVTNESGAKIWSRPYSHESTHLRTEAYKTALTVTGKAKNAESNTWYQLSDGNWVYSGNVTRRLTIRYNANGGSGAPGNQYVLKGAKLTITSAKPSREGYVFLGWSKSSSSTVSYKPGSSYTFTSAATLYAVWDTCETHSCNDMGVCSKCGKDYPYHVVDLDTRIYKVSGAATATSHTGPFSGTGSVLTTKKGDLLKVNGHTSISGEKWYRLMDGSWISGAYMTYCGYLDGSQLMTEDTDVADHVTTVRSIFQNTGEAMAFLEENIGPISKSPLIPGLRKAVTRTASGSTVTTCSNMIPQGLTFAGDYLLISAYCGCISGHRSVIYVIDGSTRKYQTTLILDNSCHVGGLAKAGDYIWVCDSGGDGKDDDYIRAYRYSDIKTALTCGINYRSIETVRKHSSAVTPSYMCSANGMLYVGPHYKEKTTAKIHMYAVSGSNLTHKGYFTVEGINKLQGISIRDNHMVLTSSLYRSHKDDNYVSRIYLFEDDSNFSRTNVTYTFDKDTTTWYEFCNMVEGCYIGSTYTYFLCESGAKKYRNSLNTRPLDQYIGFRNSLLGIG